MLYVALILSAILLALAIPAARGSSGCLTAFWLCGLGFSFVPPYVVMVAFPPVIYQFLALAVLIYLLRYAKLRRTWIAAAAISGVSAAVYGTAIRGAIEDYREIRRLQDRYPEESITQRLPEPRTAWRSPQLSTVAETDLDHLEEADSKQWSEASGARSYSLMAIHSNMVAAFVNSPGFGFTRMRRPSEAEIVAGLRATAPVAQPVPRSVPAESASPLQPRATAAAEFGLTMLHQSGIVDFANSRDFGYFKDRDHVTGFVPHAFSKVPDAVESWRVETLELVGLLRHQEPVAYVSSELPRMNELREAPVRALDSFESGGLLKLRDGESIVVADAGGRLRMLGSIRSAKQCVNCHGGERGDLLGAFSYTLHRHER